jgi:hypothetical protein
MLPRTPQKAAAGPSYHVTGITRWDNGNEEVFDDFIQQPIILPHNERHGVEVEKTEPAKGRFRLPMGTVGFTITYLSSERLPLAGSKTRGSRRSTQIGRLTKRKRHEKPENRRGSCS